MALISPPSKGKAVRLSTSKSLYPNSSKDGIFKSFLTVNGFGFLLMLTKGIISPFFSNSFLNFVKTSGMFLKLNGMLEGSYKN